MDILDNILAFDVIRAQNIIRFAAKKGLNLEETDINVVDFVQDFESLVEISRLIQTDYKDISDEYDAHTSALLKEMV